MVADEVMEQVDETVYLGCVFSKKSRCTVDLERKLSTENSVHGTLGTLLGSRHLTQKARLAIHNILLM